MTLTVALHGDVHKFMILLAEFFLEWDMFQTKDSEKNKTHILCSIHFFPQKSCRLWDNVEKYDRARNLTYDNTIRCRKDTIWMPDKWSTIRDPRIMFHTLCFSTATAVTSSCASIALYVHFLSCYNMTLRNENKSVLVSCSELTFTWRLEG